MDFHRGKIAETIIGARWRVKHHAPGAATGVFDIVGAEGEEEARSKVLGAYARERIIVSVERLD